MSRARGSSGRTPASPTPDTGPGWPPTSPPAPSGPGIPADPLPSSIFDAAPRLDLPRGPAEARRIAATIPRPSDGSRFYAAIVDGAWRVVIGRDFGRVNEPVGPPFPVNRNGGRAVRAVLRELGG